MRRYLIISLLLAAGCAHESKAPSAAATPRKPMAAPMSTRVNEWSGDWTPLFDGATLTNWAVTDFGGHGKVDTQPGQINIGAGDELSGITWTNGTLPKSNYEISLEAERLQGGDFFCGLTFPVADSYCSLILGGWGGGVVGLSSIDDNDASENETTKSMGFTANRWYNVRMRVTPTRIQGWLDEEKMIDVSIVGKKVSLRPGSIFMSAPLGVATYETAAAIRNFKLRLIEH
jgi:hypothetical protein